MDIDKKLRGLKRRKIPSDLDRILSIERLSPLFSPEEAALWTKVLAKPKGEYKLRPVQGAALATVFSHRGGFGAIGVGHGKTLIALLAGTVAKAKRPIILTAPSLTDQMRSDGEYWSNHFDLLMPKVLSYGALSTQTDLLTRYNPDFIVADEAHCLRHKTSARTRRFIRFFHENPSCGFLALSGTITAKSLLDYSHLLELSLRERAPIPFNRWELERWAACIDPDGEPARADLARLHYLVQWSSQSDLAVPSKKTIRKAFKERLVTTPGVISTKEGSCEASLHLIKHSPPHSKAIKAALKNLSARWETPEGEPIADASTKSRIFKSLSLGYYYKWDWGESAPDLEWLEAKRNLNRLVARVLRYSPKEGRDSPKLVIDWSKNGGGAVELRTAISLWEQIKDRASPLVIPVWICKEKIQYLADWLFEFGDPALLWYSSNAIGISLANLGIPTYGAGSLSPKGEICAVSIAVHGKGKNLQMYDTAFVLEPPANGATWEQLLGRTHRSGQASDLVTWHYFDYSGSLNKAKGHAEYIEETQGTRQKLNLATFLTTER